MAKLIEEPITSITAYKSVAREVKRIQEALGYAHMADATKWIVDQINKDSIREGRIKRLRDQIAAIEHEGN